MPHIISTDKKACVLVWKWFRTLPWQRDVSNVRVLSISLSTALAGLITR